MLLAALVLTAAAWLRGAEYDEQYTLFLTAGTPRPQWPRTLFPAGLIGSMQSGHASLAGVAGDLRTTDVHPPLYFWAAALWRDLAGPSLIALRMLSVLCGLVSLWLTGMIARRCRIPEVPAMLLTLGCYGFVYTNAIARGFAPAQMLTLFGVTLLLSRWPLLAGGCLGAACCCNYLAVFVAIAVILAARAWRALPAMVPFLAIAAWFFAAQHAARPGQFPPFEAWRSLLRLAEYQVAAVFGGLPLYVDGGWSSAAKLGVGLAAVALAAGVFRSRPWRAEPPIGLILAAALAPAAGLFLLGATFNNTPIELRYLSFGLPFIALLVAWACRPDERRAGQDGSGRLDAAITTGLGVPHPSAVMPQPSAVMPHPSAVMPQPSAVMPQPSAVMAGEGPPSTPTGVADRNRRGWRAFARHDGVGSGFRTLRTGRTLDCPGALGGLCLTIQLVGIAGLLLSPRTMQPARAAAVEAAGFVNDGVVLLPRGNDGVGIVGAFAIEAPPSLPLLLIGPDGSSAGVPVRYHRVVLALLAQDADSKAAIPAAQAALTAALWRRVAIGSNVEVYERSDEGK